MIVILLLALSNRMAADDQLSISNFSIFTEHTKDVSITLANENAYAGFQFDLDLPEGVTVSSYSANSARITTASELSMLQQSDGTYRFVFLSQSATPLSGTSGDAIINLTLQAAATATVGSTTGYFKNIKLAKADGTGPTYTSQSFTFTVRGNEPYVVLTDNDDEISTVNGMVNGKTLTFYYDKQKDIKGGVYIGYNPVGWFDDNYYLTTVVFDDTFAHCTEITSTGSWFYHCDNLKNVIGISNLRTENVTNMSWMFNECKALVSLDLSSLDTRNVTTMSGMFRNCSNLENLDVSNFNTEKVEDFSEMFYNCRSLTSLNIGYFNVSKANSISGMFSGCSNLTNLDLSNFVTDNIKNFSALFKGCSGLNNLDLSGFNTASATDMHEMFYECSSLTSLNISNFNTINVTNMRDMFYSCSNLKTLNLSSFNTTNVVYWGSMFCFDSKLKTIFVSDDWTSAQNSYGLFNNCTSLLGGKGTTFNSNNVNGIYARIDGGPNSDTPGYFTDIADLNKDFPYAVLSNDNKTLTFYYNGDRDNYNWMRVGETSDLSDKDWLGSAYATSITSVVFDDSFAGYTALSSTAFWFFGLSNLSSITGLNNLKTGNVTNMNSMFRGCQSLTTLDLSGFNTAKVTDMGSMFSGCSGLSTLTLGGSFDTGSVVYMNEMFQNCSSLTVLDLGSFNIAKVENMNSMFSNASNLKTIYVGTGWATTLETAGAEMFSGCTNLVGGSSTTYDATNVGFDYARIDGGPSSETPGYFTDVANNGKEVYMVLTDSNSKLTFYYDANKASRSGTVVDLIGTSGYGWSSFKDYITSVEFDPSFADYHGLTSTKEWFMSCNNLASVTGIVNLKTENVTDMTSMFQYCSALSSLDLSSLNTSNVTKMAHMFYDCQNLVSLNISGFNTAKVTGMDAMFYNCNKLESLNLSSFVTENVTNMQEMFWTCSSLTDIDVTGFETGSVTSMTQMFFGCSGLTTLDLSSFNTVNAVEMTGMFQDCSNLVTIYVGDNWSYEQAATGGNLMFDGCTSIVGGSGTEYSSANYDWRYAHVDGGTVNPGYLTDVKYKGKTDEAYAVLSSDSKTLTFYYDKDKEFRTGVVDIDTGSGLGWESYSSTITSVVFDDSFANYTSLTSTASWFMGCTNLTSITGIANLKTDNVTNMYAMFYNCSSLTSLDVSGFVTDNVTNMEKMFSACDFTTLDISNFKTDKVTNMKEMFRECRSLATLTLDKNNFKTDNVTNMWLMFKDCESLTSLDVSGFNTANVTDMTFMFHGCKELTTLDVSGFNTAKVTTMEGMFNGCEGLTTLDLSSFNTTLVTNMMSMFYGCTSLTTISASDKWSNEGVAEGTSTSTNMFYNCTSLVGENGTTYDATRTNHLYAHIDIAGDPGYFTNVIPTEPYAALSDENTKLTFYYDKMKADRNGMSVGPFNAYFDIPWSDVRLSITTVKFDNSFANYTGLTSTKWMLGDLAYLESVEGIENLKTDNVTDMSNMFNGCGITSLDLSSLNTTNVTNMSSMFEMCLNLKTLDVSNFNTANVTDMSHMFYRCEKLENLNITNFVTSSVTDMSDMFHDCKTLTSLDLSSFNTEKVTQMGEFFWGDANLQTIIVGKGWSTAAITGTHEESTFKACNALVGENGTTYDESHIGIDYAHIDGGTANPGYLTDVRPLEPYAVLSSDNKTLTFYYDKKKEDKGGMSVGPFAASNERGWYSARNTIETVVFDETFANCTSITSTAHWFDTLTGLSSISGIERLNTSSVTDMNSMFNYCFNLEEVDLSTFNTANVTDMNNMFAGCSGLTTLNFGSGFNTEKVTTMERMFIGCGKLTSLDLSGFNTANVTDMSEMFSDCTKLTSLDVSSFNTAKVTDMERTFRLLQHVEILDLSSFNTAAVTNMNSMFYDCNALKTILVSVDGWSITALTDDENMFASCLVLVGDQGTSYNEDNPKDKTYAHIDGGTANPGYLTDARPMEPYAVLNDERTELTFYYDKKKEERNGLSVGPFNTAFDVSWNSSAVSTITFDESFGNYTGLTSTKFWFMNFVGLTSIVGIKNFKTDNVTDMQQMFQNCSSLTEIDLSHFNTANVTNMASMFETCRSLTNLDLSSFNTAKVTDMSNMFMSCSALTSINLSSFNTSQVTNMRYMFGECPVLTSLDLSSFNTEKVENMGRLFWGDTNLETIYVANGWSLDGISDEDDGNMFYGCTSLVGGKGTTYGAYDSHIEKDYAHIDGGEDNPGYFTDKYGVTITAKSYSREYGAANPTFEYTVSGAVISGTPTITCDAKDSTSVGTYPITITYTKSEGEDALNITCVKGTLTITKAPLTITAKNDTIKRGQDLPTFEVEYSGFKNNETDTALTKKPTITCVATSDSLAGTYPIVVSGGEAKNYELKYVNGTLTITDDVVVTAKSYTRVYGDANPTFEFTSDGATLSGTPSINCAATATSPVGTYDIVIAKGDVTNSEVTYVNGTLTITKAPLTITAKSYTIKQGKDLPTLEVEYSGFKNNETDTVFTTKPVVSTTATKYSEPGSYDIMVKDAEAANYEITYVKGTLTITKKTETYDGSSNVLTVEDGGNIDDALEAIGGREEAAKSIAAIVWKSTEPLTTEMLKGLDNPNMLIYVQSKEQAPKDRNNVVINGVAKYVELTDAGTGNHNFYAPVEFVADSITYTREFKQATRKNVSRGWEGICLPFTVQTFTHESHGEIAPFGNSASNYHFWLHQFTEDGIVNAETIEANKPYLISMPNSDEYYEEFNQAGKVQFASANVTIPVTETMAILLGDSAHIVPTFQVVEKSASVYTLNVGDSIISTLEGSIFVNNYRDVRPFEIYTFHEPNRNAGTRAISVSSLFGGGTTGIIDVMEKQNSDEVKVYSINGTLIKKGNRNEVMNSLPKGLYIIGNQKIMVK